MKKITHHPRKQLKKTWIDLIRKEAPVAEKRGQLTARQLALFYEQGWFKALAPKKYGGLQWSLLKAVRFEEAIGWTDGSAGWTFTLCSGAGWFGAFMHPELATRVFKAKKACVAGSGAVTGWAKLLPTGNFKVTGSWKYATGAPHATLFTANCKVIKTTEKADNQPDQVRTFCFLHQEVEILKTWRPLGLIASASESFKVDIDPLPAVRVFDIDTNCPMVAESLYNVPFKVLAEATIAANLSGMTLHFLEEVDALWGKNGKYAGGEDATNGKQYAQFLEQQLALWNHCRMTLIEAVEALEQYLKVSKGRHLSQPAKFNKLSNTVSKTAHALATNCRQIVFDVYGHCGLSVATMGTVLNAVWRDFQTGSQHAMFESTLPTERCLIDLGQTLK